MKRFLIILLLFPALAFGQNTSTDPTKKLGPNPLKVLDNVVVSNKVFSHLNPSTIASITVLPDTGAIKLYGNAAKDGALIVETKALAKKYYIAYFRKVSAQYDSLYSITKSDSSFLYIVNNRIYVRNFEGKLSSIDDRNFISLEILSAEDLKNRYDISNKEYGILIKCQVLE